MHSVRGRKLPDVDWISFVHSLSNKLHLVCGELNFDELHLQRGLLGPRWRGVHSVRGWKVQGLSRISCVQQLFGRDVFCSCRSLTCINMPRVFGKLQLAWWELDLHLQRGLLRA